MFYNELLTSSLLPKIILKLNYIVNMHQSHVKIFSLFVQVIIIMIVYFIVILKVLLFKSLQL